MHWDKFPRYVIEMCDTQLRSARYLDLISFLKTWTGTGHVRVFQLEQIAILLGPYWNSEPRKLSSPRETAAYSRKGPARFRMNVTVAAIVHYACSIIRDFWLRRVIRVILVPPLSSSAVGACIHMYTYAGVRKWFMCYTLPPLSLLLATCLFNTSVSFVITKLKSTLDAMQPRVAPSLASITSGPENFIFFPRVMRNPSIICRASMAYRIIERGGKIEIGRWRSFSISLNCI